MKHILIIPSEHYLTKEKPLAGIFQGHLVGLLQEFGIKTGVISAGFTPFEYSLKPYPYTAVEKKAETTIYRSYFRTFIPGRFALKLLWPLLVRRYCKLFESYMNSEGRPDLIHAHNCLFAGVVAHAIKKKHGIPYIITEHSSLYERGFITPHQISLSREVFRDADAKTTVSTALGNVLTSSVGPEVLPFTSIYNVLETGFFINPALMPKMGGSVFTFLSVGSLDANKNHLLLIRSFAAAFANDLHFRLQIGGSGELRSELEQEVINLNISKQVEFLGHLSRQEVVKSMAECQSFVLCSTVETFGVVLIEALGLGRPVIATRCGGPEDIVTDLNGLLVPVGDQELLTVALKRMVNKYNDYNPMLIQEDCINRFGRSAFFKRINTIYTSIINRQS